MRCNGYKHYKKDGEFIMSKNDTKTTKGKFKVGKDTGVKYSSDNQPSPEAKKAGWAKVRARKDLAEALFQKLLKLGTFDKAMIKIDKNVDEGKLKEFIDVAKIITPKDVDITTKGEKIGQRIIPIAEAIADESD